MFWVASAPLSGDGTVNVSPKGAFLSLCFRPETDQSTRIGHDVFHLVSPTQAWYLDITGSGNETISHLNEPGNGRLTISAFPPIPLFLLTSPSPSSSVQRLHWPSSYPPSLG
jgi:hypothetical protein